MDWCTQRLKLAENMANDVGEGTGKKVSKTKSKKAVSGAA